MISRTIRTPSSHVPHHQRVVHLEVLHVLNVERVEVSLLLGLQPSLLPRSPRGLEELALLEVRRGRPLVRPRFLPSIQTSVSLDLSSCVRLKPATPESSPQTVSPLLHDDGSSAFQLSSNPFHAVRHLLAPPLLFDFVLWIFCPLPRVSIQALHANRARRPASGEPSPGRTGA